MTKLKGKSINVEAYDIPASQFHELMLEALKTRVFLGGQPGAGQKCELGIDALDYSASARFTVTTQLDDPEI